MMNLYNVEQFGNVTGKGSLFDDISLPDRINQKTLYDKIMYDNWDLEPYISDFDILHRFILNWFQTRYYAWEMMDKALSQTYEPLENMDRTETETITRERNYTGQTSTEDSGENETKVSAFNSSSYQPSQIDTSEASGSENRNDNENETVTNERHSHGTIGVITNQDMLQKEIDIRRYDIYSIISKEFTNEFMLLCM